MSDSRYNYQKPSRGDYDLAMREWQLDAMGSCHTEALTNLFKAFPDNTRKSEVIVKVSALNDFYRTRIWDTQAVADEITKLTGLDALLRAGDPGAVDLIKACGGKRKLYSFATKYCCFHNPSAYQIYDRYVDDILRSFRNSKAISDFQNADLKDYRKFVEIVDGLNQQYELKASRFLLDKYLWLAGKSMEVIRNGKASLIS